MNDMNDLPTNNLTETEQLYLDFEPEAPKEDASGKTIFLRAMIAFFSGIGRALLSPTGEVSKSERRLMDSLKLRKFYRYRHAVERKAENRMEKGDEKLLKKLNEAPFVFQEEAFDPDEYTKQLYEEYMKAHQAKENQQP